MEKWDTIDVDDCPHFRTGVTRLVQHVYKQTGRPLKGGGNSLYYNQIQFRFIEGKPHTTVVQIAEGCDLGAEMVCIPLQAVRTASLAAWLASNLKDNFTGLLYDCTRPHDYAKVWQQKGRTS